MCNSVADELHFGILQLTIWRKEQMNGVSIDFLRNEWGSFFKWTVGLSLFLITAITTAIILFGNIFLTWFFLGRTLFRIHVPLFNRSRGGPIQEEQFNRLVNNAKLYERPIMISFAVGFISFIIFLMGFILN
jgi:hypothetical protein